MNRFSCYVRARLQRRLFVWFGVAILVSGIAFTAVLFAFSAGSGVGFSRDMGKLRFYVGNRFAEVWDEPEARAKLGTAMANELEVSVMLTDPQGKQLETFGKPCQRPWFEAQAGRNGKTLGNVFICAERPQPFGPLRHLAPLFAAGVILWGLSGMVARRLSRPLEHLAQVALEIGQGRYGARARVGAHGHGEVVVLAAAINEMAKRVERQMSDQRELLAAVSHELRTPLARIRLLTELSRDGVNLDKHLNELDREVMEIDVLVGDLLASSRLDFAALEKQTLPAVEVGKRALERAGLPLDKLHVVGNVSEKSALIAVDPTLCARALANLLDNANKHGGGVLSLRVEVSDRVVTFDVEDAGRGLEAGEEKRIFETFYRRSDEKAREQGSLGLGLSLVSRIAEAHGGRAHAKNRPEGGACIGIELPLARDVGVS